MPRRKKIPVMYEYSPALYNLVKDVVEYKYGVSVDIIPLWVSDMSTKSKIYLGKIRKASKLMQFIASKGFPVTPDFIMFLNMKFHIGSDRTGHYFVHEQWLLRTIWHELSHIGFNEDGKVIMVPHDIEDFISVFKVFGIPENIAKLERDEHVYNRLLEILNNHIGKINDEVDAIMRCWVEAGVYAAQ